MQLGIFHTKLTGVSVKRSTFVNTIKYSQIPHNDRELMILLCD